MRRGRCDLGRPSGGSSAPADAFGIGGMSGAGIGSGSPGGCSGSEGMRPVQVDEVLVLLGRRMRCSGGIGGLGGFGTPCPDNLSSCGSGFGGMYGGVMRWHEPHTERWQSASH